MKMKTPKLHNSDWKRRISLVPVFTLAFGIFTALVWSLPAPAEAALQYVGGTTANNGAGAATYNVSLTGLTGGLATSPAAGDLVIVVTGFTGTADGNPGITTPTDYTEVFDLYSNDTADANLSVNWKIMGATPDTSITVTGSGNTARGAATVVHVWRGADPTSPMDVSPVSATAINASRPDSPSITPVTNGAYVLTVGLGTGGTTQAAMTAPTGYGNALSVVGNGTTYDSVANIASIAWAGGAVDPAAWTGGTTTTADSWAAGTLAIRPAPILTVGATGTQTAAVYRNTTANYVGGAFTFSTDISSVNVTSITIAEQGTVDALTNLANAKLYYETAATCAYNGTETAFDATGRSFNAANGTATFTNAGVAVGASQVCFYVVLDIGAAALAETIEIQITDPSTQVVTSLGTVTPATAVAIAGTSTLSKLPSAISDCSGCHGYTTSFSDGTARNTPAGTFAGSHNAHVIKGAKTCDICHVNPATNGHRNSNIEMKSGATAIDGGYYDKNNNSGYDAPGDTTFAQSNNPAMSTCRTVYCHSEGTGATLNSGDTRPYDAPVSNLNWGATGTCGSCHGFGPSYANGTPKANSHAVHRTSCSTCHNSTTTDGTSITGPANHVNKTYEIVVANGATIGAYAYNVNGGTCTNISCHRPAGGAAEASRAWGTTFSPATDYECVDCHKLSLAITVGPAAGGTRDPVVNEFNQTWGHRNAARTTANGAATDADCIVCHLEGKYTGAVGTAVLRASYHGDGYIDLRDPDNSHGSGEVPIYDINNSAPFRFAKFSTSYAAGSRTSTGHQSNNVDNVLTQKFCIPCHDNNGALNTTARSNNGGTGTAAMPFGGVNLGANYTVTNGAMAAGGLVDTKTQFATTNTSVHPVLGPRNKDYPTAARLAVPYNNIDAGRVAGSHVQANSVVLNCFDCHNAPTTPLTDRTIVAHGNTNTIRGTIYVTGPTLCTTCHTGYTTDTDNHLAGSAGASSGTSGQGMSMSTFCMYCHASADAKPARPLPAQDFHGYSRLVGNATWSGSDATGGYPYGFIRNTARWIAHKPYSSTQWGVTTATCQGDGTHCAGNGGSRTYTPGGTY